MMQLIILSIKSFLFNIDVTQCDNSSGLMVSYMKYIDTNYCPTEIPPIGGNFQVGIPMWDTNL